MLPLTLLFLAGCAGTEMSSREEQLGATSNQGYSAKPDSAGYKAIETGQLAAAERYYAAAYKETPNNPYNALNLGAALQRQGRMKEAEPLLRQAYVQGTDVHPIAWTTDLARGHTVSEVACQNLMMGLPPATVAGSAATCQRTEIAFVQPAPATRAQPLQTVAAPVTPTVAAATARRHTIYFDFDKSALTADGRRVVDTVVAEMRSNSALKAALVGKTDQSGTDTYNMALSERRADVAQDALVAAGISTYRVNANWVGETQPTVSTPENGRERGNRVVEIVVQ